MMNPARSRSVNVLHQGPILSPHAHEKGPLSPPPRFHFPPHRGSAFSSEFARLGPDWSAVYHPDLPQRFEPAHHPCRAGRRPGRTVPARLRFAQHVCDLRLLVEERSGPGDQGRPRHFHLRQRHNLSLQALQHIGKLGRQSGQCHRHGHHGERRPDHQYRILLPRDRRRQLAGPI